MQDPLSLPGHSKAWYSSPLHPACSSCPAVAGHRAGQGFRSPAPLHSLGDVPADPLPPTGAVRSAVFPVGIRRRYPHTAQNPWTPDDHIAPPESGDPSCRQSRIISCSGLSPFSIGTCFVILPGAAPGRQRTYPVRRVPRPPAGRTAVPCSRRRQRLPARQRIRPFWRTVLSGSYP